jgi:HSP90 family molecular chaperone
MAKLRHALTRRVLKLLEEEIKKDEEKYNKWFDEFNNYLKEGLSQDRENADQLIKLMRFKSTKTKNNYISLDDYIEKMKPGQRNIYFIVSANPNVENPFLEPFENSSIPVLVLPTHIDEICLRNVDQYKNYKFINIESNFDEVSQDLETPKDEGVNPFGIPESDITPFCLWLKSELSPTINKVTISKRLKSSPAVIVGEVSSSMRAMLAMVDQQQFEQASRNQALEFNPNHSIMVKINKLRKLESETASLLMKEVFDKVMLQSGIPYDIAKSTERSYKLLDMLLDYKVSSIDEAEPQVVVEDVASSESAKNH